MLPLYINIKKMRKKRGMSQLELAEATGYTNYSSISKIEDGKVDLPQSKIILFAKALGTTPAHLMGWRDDEKINSNKEIKKSKGIRIPVLGRVIAGIPVDAIEEIIDYEEIDEHMAQGGDFYGLQIKGDSMEPRFVEGDVVIVRKQNDIDNGQIGIVLVNGDEATVKKIKKVDNGIMLISFNNSYEPIFYSKEEIQKKPVQIIGRVVELRGKF